MKAMFHPERLYFTKESVCVTHTLRGIKSSLYINIYISDKYPSREWHSGLKPSVHRVCGGNQMLIAPSAFSNGESRVVPKARSQEARRRNRTSFLHQATGRVMLFIYLFYFYFTLRFFPVFLLWPSRAKKKELNGMLAFSIFNLILGTGCTPHWQVSALLWGLNDLLGNIMLLCQTEGLTEISKEIKDCGD